MKARSLHPFIFMRNEFVQAFRDNQAAFGLQLHHETIEKLADYYEMIIEANPLLHLVAPSSPGEFATRHILESLTLLEFLHDKASLADVGAGAGLPSVPCLIARKDITAILIESKEKKANFLENVVERCELRSRVQIFNRQFSEVESPNVEFVTCRALDKFIESLPRLLKWGYRRRFLLFGGNSMREALKSKGIRFNEKLMPLSKQRFLYEF